MSQPITNYRRWDQRKAENLRENVKDTAIRDIESSVDSLDSEILQAHIDETTQKVTELFNQTAQETFCSKCIIGQIMKINLGLAIDNRARKRYQLCKIDCNKRALHHASKFYKQTMNKYINQYNRKQQVRPKKMQNT